MSTIHKTKRWTHLLSLRILKVEHIDLLTYMSILSTYPNLYIFYFLEEKVLQMSTFLPHYINHKNLKQLGIKEKYIGPISCVAILNEYLLCVSNLEHLSIHITKCHMRSLPQLFEFDWLASLIFPYLPLLCQFYFHLPVFRAKKSQQTCR